jgi:secondary thiamine-phosphate synthase enzyme
MRVTRAGAVRNNIAGGSGTLRQHRTILSHRTTGPGFTDITGDVAAWLREAAVSDGAVTLFIRHTSASLTIQENADPDVLRDLAIALDLFAPQTRDYHHATEGPDDMPAHIKSMLTSVSITVPVAAGRMMLGTWQALYLIEHRTAPHDRDIIVHYIGE